MSMHQTTIGKSQVHLTPRWILDPLGRFFFDPCASSPRPWDIGTDLNYTEADNGLTKPWPEKKRGWLNPPFHRYQIARWLQRMAEHNNGIALVHARTETDWFDLVWRGASSLFFLSQRVIFLREDGSPQIISNPESKHFGKSANSGAPVVLAGFGDSETDLLASLPRGIGEHDALTGNFVPLVFQRFMLVMAIQPPKHSADATWGEIVREFLSKQGAPVAVSDLYRALADHPRNTSNPNWQAKLRQTLQRGAGVSVGRDQWVAARPRCW